MQVLEALTTENCQERLSLERLEILGDAFLKFAVGRRLFLMDDLLDEGELTNKRSNAVNNSNLFKLAVRSNLQVYIRDQPFDPFQFFALGHPCKVICTEESEAAVHNVSRSSVDNPNSEMRCSKNHHWLHKKTMADAVEALVGGFIVDSGFKAAAAFLRWIGIKVEFGESQVTEICAASSRYMPLAASVNIATLEKSLGYSFHHKVYPKMKPGHLTDLRSALVNNRAFANVAVARSFHKFLISDSSALSEAIEAYVDFVQAPAKEGGFREGPRCPKVTPENLNPIVFLTVLDN
ncbi:unnamed protein product [Linum tenue]|uniref:RNase III domain-containing protein n=1 Tax=Linum tenue TaxID=586396 RepID=A0AAV0IBM8_9ROSI|nr:unnamed protein product [Linum tenue]